VILLAIEAIHDERSQEENHGMPGIGGMGGGIARMIGPEVR